MSESKHTPGQWKVEGYVEGPIVTACEGRLTIAEVHDHSGTSETHTTKEAVANARLIAAAPDLLKACKELLKDVDPINISQNRGGLYLGMFKVHGNKLEDIHIAIAEAEKGDKDE